MRNGKLDEGLLDYHSMFSGKPEFPLLHEEKYSSRTILKTAQYIAKNKTPKD